MQTTSAAQRCARTFLTHFFGGRLRARPFPLRAGVLSLVLRTAVSGRTRRFCPPGASSPEMRRHQTQPQLPRGLRRMLTVG